MAEARTASLTESVFDNAKRVSEDLTRTGRNVLYAGLGVLAFTEETARETFSRMVDRGKTLEKDEDKLLARATGEARELGRRLEDRVRSTVSTTLHRAGVPSRDEIRDLSARVEALTRKVDELVAKG